MNQLTKTLDQKNNMTHEGAMAWLQSGVDLESRVIEITMPVNEIMSTIIIRSLVKMSELSNEPITIHLSSYGGEAYEAFAIYDAIRACPCDVVIIGWGKLMSAGFIIFLAGDIRLAMPHTTFMIHSAAYASEGKVKDQEIEVLEGKRINNTMLKIIAERTNQSVKWWSRQILSHDRYFDVSRAKELGLINAEFNKEVAHGKPGKRSKKKRNKARRKQTKSSSNTKRRNLGARRSSNLRSKKV